MVQADSNDRPIRALPIEVVRVIAAGETIDSLAAAVRELAENAIDAGATRITVALWVDRWDVCVTDNGLGMLPIALKLAARPHTTSKIHDRDDLRQISTLGFRGEALYSLACLGQLDICSQFAPLDGLQSGLQTGLSKDRLAGLQVYFDHDGQPDREQPIAIAPGTIVTVRNLFADLPGRRDALPTLTRQRAWTRQTIEKIALCHPEVTWQVLWNDRLWLAIAAGATAADILAQFSPTVRRDDLTEYQTAIEVEPKREGEDECKSEPEMSSQREGTIAIVLGLPDRCHRRRPDWIYLAVNGRIIQQPDLEQSILRATARTLPRGRYPVCLVHLQLPPDRLDWNRTPAKTEIYLRDLDRLQGQLETAIVKAYQFNDRLEPLTPDRVKTLLSVAEAAQPYTVSGSSISSISSLDRESSTTDPTLTDRISPDRATQATRITPNPTAPPLPNALRATSQVNNTYIVAEHDSGLWLIEQHIAHERVLYEQLRNRWRLLDLEPPAIVDGLSPRQVENLRAIGIETEVFGDTSWVVRQIPALLLDWYRLNDATRPESTGYGLPDRGLLDLSGAMIELSQGDLEAAIVATACRSAIRNGTPLTLPQMQALLNDWQRTRNPHTCPHGRPIYLSLSESSLARFFRRHWVIGKSHGI